MTLDDPETTTLKPKTLTVQILKPLQPESNSVLSWK